jgi:hypothetical protein
MPRSLDYQSWSPSRQALFADEFAGVDKAAKWSVLETDNDGQDPVVQTVSIAFNNTYGPAVRFLIPDEVANGECYLSSLARFAIRSQVAASGRVATSWGEGDREAINAVFGLSSAAGADLITDAGLLAASHSAAVIYKANGANWVCETSSGTAKTTTTSTTAANKIGWQSLRIVVEAADTGVVRVLFEHDPEGGTGYQPLYDSTGFPIRHLLTTAGLAAAAVVIGAKGADSAFWVERVELTNLK